MIRVEKLSYTIGKKQLLQDVSFSVEPGEMLTVIGANGAGKSTLLKLLCKEERVTSGAIYIRNNPIQEYTWKELAKFRAVLTQHHTLAVSFTVQEMILMGRYPHFDQTPNAQDYEVMRAVMELTGVTAFANREYNTLSGGEQQRVQLARVIAQIYDQPGALLFLDEPTNGLDLLHQQQLLQLVRSLADRGYCIVSILHDINFASRYSDRVLLLKNGTTIAYGTPQEVVTCAHIHTAFNIEVKLLASGDTKYPLVMPSAILND